MTLVEKTLLRQRRENKSLLSLSILSVGAVLSESRVFPRAPGRINGEMVKDLFRFLGHERLQQNCCNPNVLAANVDNLVLVDNILRKEY